MLLALALSGAACVLITTYALRTVSQRGGESQRVLLDRARTRVQGTVSRARRRWHSGAATRSWRQQWRTAVVPIAAVLAGEIILVLAGALSTGDALGGRLVVFAVTVLLTTSLLANAVMALLWLAGPEEHGPGGPAGAAFRKKLPSAQPRRG